MGRCKAENRLQQVIAATQEAERMQVWGKYDSEKLAKLAKTAMCYNFSVARNEIFKRNGKVILTPLLSTKSFKSLFRNRQSYHYPLDAEAVTLNARNSKQLQLDVEAQNLLLTAPSKNGSMGSSVNSTI